MYYRTRTYLAGDWDGDRDAIEQIHKWNEGDKWSLSFSDAHNMMQARDSSLNCSIKRSLHERLKASKKFVLVVGNDTITRRAGMCRYCVKDACCTNKSNWCGDLSFIEYECDKAVKLYSEEKMDIVVLYNATFCNKNLCPLMLRTIGDHVAMKKIIDGEELWDYQTVRNALE